MVDLPCVSVPTPFCRLLDGTVDYGMLRHNFDTFLRLRWQATLPKGPLFSLLPLSIKRAFAEDRLEVPLLALMRRYSSYIAGLVAASPFAVAQRLLGAEAEALDLDLLRLEARAWANEPLLARPDLTISASGQVQVLEFNFGSGFLGMFEYEQFLGLIDSVPSLTEAAKASGLILESPWLAMAKLLDAKDAGTVLLVDFCEPSCRSGAMAEYLNRYRRRGKVLYGFSPEAVHTGKEGLTVDTCPVDTVYVNMAPRHYRSPPHMDAYNAAIKSGRVKSLSPQLATLLSSKAGLALLHAAPAAAQIPDELAALVPPTMILEPANAQWRGGSVDAPAFARRRKDDLVLKRASSEAGIEVTIGRHRSQNDWDHLVDQALSGPDRYVLQAYVEPDCVTHYYYDEETRRPTEASSPAIYSPYIIGRVTGIGVRLGAGATYDRPLVAPDLGDCAINVVGKLP